jgi:histidinol-phosphate aminotransferase
MNAKPLSSKPGTSVPTPAPSVKPVDPVVDAPDYIKAIAPYQPGRPIDEVARAYRLDPSRIIKLASNENPLGMPDSARRAAVDAMVDVGRYPDGNGFDLKQALAARHRVPPEWLTLGNGSNDVLELVARALCGAGESIVFSEYAFAVYPLATMAVGARPIVVPAREFGHDLEAMADAVAEDTRVMFVANPNNPTGTFAPGMAVRRLLERVPARVAVVLDEAYTEYLEPAQRYDSIGWIRTFPNLIVSRTFSKAFGLAGLRIGFGVAQAALTDLLNRVRQPFNVNVAAQAAALAALADVAFLERSRQMNRAGIDRLQQGFAALGLRYVPSHANFVLVEVGDAARVNEALLEAGIIVRPVANYGLPTWLRITAGLPEENAALLEALARIVRV